VLLWRISTTNRDVFSFLKLWSLYPATLGQAIPSAFGQLGLALTAYEGFVGASEQFGTDTNKFKNLSNQVNNMSSQLSNAIDEVSRAIESVTATISENAINSREILVSAAKAQESMNEINEMSIALELEAKKLQMQISNFKL